MGRVIFASFMLLAMLGAAPLCAMVDDEPVLTETEIMEDESLDVEANEADVPSSEQNQPTAEAPEPDSNEDVVREFVTTPEASVFTGAARYKIPIKVPPGRITPEIALAYDSSRKSSWVGVGWNLTMGAVQRATKKGVSYDPASKDFVVLTADGGFELAHRADWSAYGECYGAKVEESFTRYQRIYGSPGEQGSWIVMKKDGTKYYSAPPPSHGRKTCTAPSNGFWTA